MKEPRTKEIICPYDSSKSALLFTYPHPYAGVWVSEDGSDVCSHDDIEVETVVEDYYEPAEESRHGQYEYKVEVCSLCGVTVEQ